jgi:hypothetical protein
MLLLLSACLFISEILRELDCSASTERAEEPSSALVFNASHMLQIPTPHSFYSVSYAVS